MRKFNSEDQTELIQGFLDWLTKIEDKVIQ
jgi:hypothetical protein